MVSRKLALWLCACGSGATTAPEPPAPTGDLVITDVTIVPMSGDGEQPHQTVVVRGDRIVAIGPSASLHATGTRTIDGAGKWLMPGLADMHVHTWRDADLAMFVAAGVTTIRNMWGVPQHVAWRREIDRGERFGPTIVTAGSLIDGNPPAWPGSVVLEHPDGAEALVTAQQAAGYDFIKVVNQLSRESYDALAAAAARHGLVVAGHVPYAAGLDGVLAAHQRSIEHLDGYLPALVAPDVKLPPFEEPDAWSRAILAHADLARLPAVVERTKAAGAWNCPTLIGNERIPELYDLAAVTRKVAWLDLVPVAQRARWDDDWASHHPTDDDRKINREIDALFAKVAAALAAAGAPILVGTDCGGPYVVAGESLHDEIELLVGAGIPRPRVLRAATVDASRFLGHPTDGVIAVGARADLILVASDPLAAPLPLVPDGVVLRGRWQARADLEARLADVRARTGPPTDPWHTPLAGATSFRVTVRGTPVAAERVAVEPTLVAQLVDFGGGLDTTVSLDTRDHLEIRAGERGFVLELHGDRTGSAYVVAGHDLGGHAVELKAPLPVGTIVTTPGIAGAIRLAAVATTGARAIHALEVSYANGPALAAHHYMVQRRPGGGLALVEGTRTIELVVRDNAVAAMTVDGQTWERVP